MIPSDHSVFVIPEVPESKIIHSIKDDTEKGKVTHLGKSVDSVKIGDIIYYKREVSKKVGDYTSVFINPDKMLLCD